MAGNIYDVGELVRVCSYQIVNGLKVNGFTDSNGAAVDPTAVMLRYWRVNNDGTLNGTVTTKVYLTDPITRDGTGLYHFDVDTTSAPGQYEYRWYSTGTGQAAQDGAFYVKPSLGG